MLTNILQSIGRTPLLRLNALGADLPGTVWLKLENRNPGGSIKDRVAFHVIDKTMEWGDIEAGGTIVEATSGNLGIGIALVAAVRGLHCVLTMPDSMSVERRNLLHALGAELVLTPAAEGMKGAIKVAEKLAEERNGLLFGQFSNPLAVEAHYLTTGPEILADSVGHMDVLVAGVGSGSSITGTGRFLKENIPGFKVMAMETVLAWFSKGIDLDVLLVVGLSMLVCTVLGGIIGVLLPFVARRIGTDPATLSSPPSVPSCCTCWSTRPTTAR